MEKNCRIRSKGITTNVFRPKHMINATQWMLLHAAYGKAILQTHVIEQRVALQVAIWHGFKSSRSDRPFNDAAFSKKYLSLRKASFGALLKIGLSSGALSEEDGEALERYRQLRNLLVHDVSESISLRLLTKNDSDNVIAELNEIARNFEGISSEIMKSIQFLFEAAGGDLDMVDKKLALLLNELSKLDILVPPPIEVENKELSHNELGTPVPC